MKILKGLEEFSTGVQLEYPELKLLAAYENGNHYTAIFNDGTKVKETIDPAADHMTYNFPENFDLKITNMCPVGCRYCHESSVPYGHHGDIMSIKVFDRLHAGTEISCGGGSALSHPDIIPFLRKMKKHGIIANLTVNQKELARPALAEVMRVILKEDLVHGVGVSLTDHGSFRRIVDPIFEGYENLVVHVIAGIFSVRDISCIANRKVLILGYKNLNGRRAGEFYESDSSEIKSNIMWLKGKLNYLAAITKAMSFDCLGIEQLDVKNTMNIGEHDWTTLFQGSDTDVADSEGNITCCTMYVDAVTRTAARMSTASLDKRYLFSDDDTIEDIFKKTLKDW